MPADHRDLRNVGLAKLDLVAEHSSAQIAVGKDAMLQWQKAASAVADMDNRQAIFQRHIQKPHDLFDGMWIPSPALDARVIGVDGDLAALHNTDARHHSGARHCAVVFATSGKCGKLQKGRAGVQ